MSAYYFYLNLDQTNSKFFCTTKRHHTVLRKVHFRQLGIVATYKNMKLCHCYVRVAERKNYNPLKRGGCEDPGPEVRSPLSAPLTLFDRRKLA